MGSPDAYHKYDRSVKGRYRKLRAQASSRGLEFDLAPEAHAWLLQQPCHWCDGPLNETGGGLDRLDNSRGYVAGNVVAACEICNMMRGRRFKTDLMRVLGSIIRYARLHDPDGFYPDGKERTARIEC